MNESELNLRAQRLLERVNAMGFTKDGMPMTLDQATELVAAGEGISDANVLRVMAKKATELDAAATPTGHGTFAAGFTPGFRIPPLVLPRVPDDALINALLVAYGPHDDTEVAFSFEQWRLLMEELASRAGVEPITGESEHAAEQSLKAMVAQQTWKSEAQRQHLLNFIRECGLMGELVKYTAYVTDPSRPFEHDPASL